MSGKARTRVKTPLAAAATDAKAKRDLLEQRDTFIQTFFKKGAELTEELLQEDERLRKRLREVEAENAKLRVQIASDDAIRDLIGKIDDLERDKRELVARYRDVQESSSHYSRRFSEIEAENAKLASMYVASYQLHSTLDLRSVVRQIKELLAQFVGARAFAIYVADDEHGQVVPIASEGVPMASLAPIKGGEGAIGKAFATGYSYWTEGDATHGTMEDPAACVPMRMADRVAGVIVVFATFEQKPIFVDVDFELFKLLGAHAGSALAAARLFGQYGARIASIDAFIDVE